ncbi:helix-turn-helix domain-containing protein [Nitrincola sp. A-D6]|uniref:helix-turn-helix domain-containing protein n=1 Tax=Nitrincola sp. A-D6 TaxID=1545442 RepID=UPI00068FC595|nr:helix-turn-helix domain-containing protein [Nitrincola sp. A-D6]
MSDAYQYISDRWKHEYEQNHPEVLLNNGRTALQSTQFTMPPIVKNPSQPSKKQGNAHLWTDQSRQCDEHADQPHIDPVVAAAIEIRKSLRLTQAKFARCLDISPRTLGEWEQGKRRPSGAARTLLIWVVDSPDRLKSASRALKRS